MKFTTIYSDISDDYLTKLRQYILNSHMKFNSIYSSISDD